MNSRLKHRLSVTFLIIVFAVMFVKTNIQISEEIERLESKIESIGEVRYRTLML